MSFTGRQLGRYRLFEPLGSGGMSIVYRGLDSALERDVAVKVLHPHLAMSPAARERFAREARAVARLKHPNILEVFDVSPENAAEAYLVTEYIRGTTLQQFLGEHTGLLPEIAALLVHAVAGALAHAHAAQVVHRDVKPENVMVRADGVLKLTDFGIAKIFDRDEGMTQTGTLVGSPAHMAPEIIAGEEAHFPADVFSAGTLLYSAITGELPFTATNTPSLLQRILEGTYADPREKVPSVSDALAEVVTRCLARNPRERFADATALRDALAEVLLEATIADPEMERLAFFADPKGYQAALTQRLVDARLERAESHLAAGRRGRALNELSLILALAPSHSRALTLRNSLQRRARRRRRLWVAARLVAGVAVVVLGGVVAERWLRAPHSAIPGHSIAPAALGGAAPARVNGSAASAPRAAVGAASGTPTPAIRPTLVPGEPVLLPAPAAPPRHPSALADSAADAPALASSAPVSVAVLIRPYGQLSVDGRPPSGEALARHALSLPPGHHRLTVSCTYCDEVTEDVDVARGEDNVFHLRAQLKPAELAFRFQPRDARVRVGADERSAAETQQRPFRIESPRGPSTFRHRVEYEVTAKGFATSHRTVYLEPGKLTLVEGALERS